MHVGKYLTELAMFLMNGVSANYNQEEKDKFKKIGKKAMNELAQLIELTEYKWDFNPGGIAVSGDLHLMGMWGKENGVHIFMNKDFMGSKTPWGDVCFRTIAHMQDYGGGANQWLRFEELKNDRALKQRILALRKKEEKEEKGSAFCPNCISFGVDCSVDEDEYSQPCDRFKPVKEHDPKTCGCEYRGNDMWSCGHIDNESLSD